MKPIRTVPAGSPIGRERCWAPSMLHLHFHYYLYHKLLYNPTILLKAEGDVFTHQHVVIVVIHWCSDAGFCQLCVHLVIWEACLSGCGMFWTLCWRVDFVLASNRSQRNTSPSGGGKSLCWRMIYKEGVNPFSSLLSASFHPHSPVTPSDRGIHSQVSHLCVCVCGL